MKLIDVLETVNESSFVEVVDLTGYRLAVYDGKNNIPSKYNACDVISINAINKDAISIMIKLYKVER